MKAKHIAIIVAAGKGLRFLASMSTGSDTKKQFIALSGESVLERTLRTFADCACFKEIILVLSPEDFDLGEHIIENVSTATPVQIVAGGATRFESVYNGLSYIADDCAGNNADFCVSIHDGVRPLVTQNIIEEGIQIAETRQSALPVVPIKETIKRVGKNGQVVETVSRDFLVRSQTPQTFAFSILWDAFQRAIQAQTNGDITPVDLTDEAKVYELFARSLDNQPAVPIQTYPGSENNIKITTFEDLALASAILNKQ